MTQTVIINNFANYLKYYEKKHLEQLAKITQDTKNKEQLEKEKKEFTERINFLITESAPGLCFGFALVHAAMDSIGELTWWEEVLIQLATWDGKEHSLKKEVSLGSKVSTLEDLFNRAFSYVIDSQNLLDDTYFSGRDQLNILQPDAYRTIKPASKKTGEAKSIINRSFFELLDDTDSKIKTIKTRKIIAGHLTKEQLMHDLEHIPEKAIILVHRDGHTIRLARKGASWMVYDPNYNHTKKATIHKIIKSTSECIDEILEIQGNSIAIEAASYDEQAVIQFPEYGKLLQTSPISVIKDSGLLIMAKHSPDVLLQLVKQIDNSENGTHLLKTIIHELQQNGKDSTLQMVAMCAPNVLLLLMKQVDYLVFELIYPELTQKTSSDWTTLQLMLRYAPEASLQLVKKIDNSVDGKKLFKLISQELTQKTQKTWTTLQLMIRYSSEVLLQLMNQGDNTEDKKNILKLIVQELPKKNQQGWTTLNMMIRNSPEALLQLVKQIDNSEDGTHILRVIIQELTQKNPEDCTVFQLIMLYTPDAWLQLVKQIDNSTDGIKLFKIIINELTQKTPAGWTGLQLMAYASPKALLHLVNQIDYSENGTHLFQIINQELSKTNPTGLTTLQLMEQYSPEAVLQLKKSPLQISPACILTELCKKKVSGETALSLINNPDILLNTIHSLATAPGTEEENKIVLTKIMGEIKKRLFADGDASSFIDLLLERRNGLDVFLKELSITKEPHNKTLWQTMCDKDPFLKRKITNTISRFLTHIKDNELLLTYEKEIRRALLDKNAKYRGICKQTGFFHDHYVKTDLYKVMLETIDKTIQKNLDEVMERRNNSASLALKSP